MTKVAELEVWLTSNADKAMGDAESSVKAGAKKIEATKPKVDANVKPAIEGIERVEAAAKKIVSAKTVAVIDADIERGQAQVAKISGRIEELQARALGGLDVTADVKKAETQLAKVERSLSGLVDARSKIDIDADTTKAEAAVQSLSTKVVAEAKSAGDRGGRSLSDGLDSATRGAGEKVGALVGGELEDTLVSALTAIPIAGGIILAAVGIGKAITGAIQDGLQQEVGFDRLEALTGIDEPSAVRLGRQASEAYANGFGESIESNMDATRLALQFSIIDSDSTNAEAKKTIEGLAGIADVLSEDVQPVATAVTTLLRTGLSQSAQQAFDLIAAGSREGVNRADDLLDTLTEYPALFKRLGLSGPESLGLINQALEGGARNSDLAADALKEFQIRATDASELSAEGFKSIGLNAEEMTAKIASGGEGAREGLDQVLDGLREMEDPVARNAAAVALFGTQAEDLGDALFNMDLSNAVDQLGQVEGAAQRMFDTLADNDASKIEVAGRNIEVAMDGIKGALAAGFSQPLADVAEFVSQNRGPVMQFFLDLANGALDFGESMVNAAADSTVALGEFIAGPGAQAVETLIQIQKALNPFADVSELETLRDGMREFDDVAAITAETMREDVGGAIDTMRGKLNEVGEPAVAMGVLNDASLRLAEAVGAVGANADGSMLALEGFDAANVGATEAGLQLEGQVRAAIVALSDEVSAAEAAGESQEALKERYLAGRDALIEQMVQMGLTREQAQALIDTVMATPDNAVTNYSSNSNEERGKVQSLADRIVTLPDGSVVITADTSPARYAVDRVITDYSGRTIRLNVATDSIYTNSLGGGYHGGVVDFMAQGGIPDLTPMGSTASVVPANTWRVVGDRGDVAEAFIPLDGSPRSLAILAETIRRMPGLESDSGMGGGHVSVSLAGAEMTLVVDGRPMRAIVQEQIVQAQAATSDGLSGGNASR